MKWNRKQRLYQGGRSCGYLWKLELPNMTAYVHCYPDPDRWNWDIIPKFDLEWDNREIRIEGRCRSRKTAMRHCMKNIRKILIQVNEDKLTNELCYGSLE